jgi:hypothetical protein
MELKIEALNFKFCSRERFISNRATILAYFPIFKQEVLGRTNRVLSFDTARTE